MTKLSPKLNLVKLREVANVRKEQGRLNVKPYIEIGDVDIDTKQYLIKEKKSIEGCKKARLNDVIVSRVRPTRGAVSIIKENEIEISSAFTVLETKSNLYSKYLYYSLAYNKTFFRYLEKLQKGTSYPSCREEDIINFSIHIPEISVQKKIVSILEKVERIKEIRNEIDTLRKDFLNTTFVEMFGDPQINNKKWKIVKIGDCVQESQYGTSSKSNNERIGYPIIGMNHISFDGEINLLKYNHVDISEEEFDKIKLQKGDVLFNRTNSPELIGKTAYWNLDLDAVIASYLVKLKMNNKCDPMFFTFLMNTAYFKKLFYSSSKKAVNQANISPTLLKTFSIYLPPINLQKKFSMTLEKINSLKIQQRNSGKFINNLFNNLIQKAFKGELVC